MTSPRTSREFRKQGREALQVWHGEAFSAEVFEKALRKTDRFITHKYGKGLMAVYDSQGLVPGVTQDRWGCEFGECGFDNLFFHYAECLSQPTGTRTAGHALAQQHRRDARYYR